MQEHRLVLRLCRRGPAPTREASSEGRLPGPIRGRAPSEGRPPQRAGPTRGQAPSEGRPHQRAGQAPSGGRPHQRAGPIRGQGYKKCSNHHAAHAHHHALLTLCFWAKASTRGATGHSPPPGPSCCPSPGVAAPLDSSQLPAQLLDGLESAPTQQHLAACRCIRDHCRGGGEIGGGRRYGGRQRRD